MKIRHLLIAAVAVAGLSLPVQAASAGSVVQSGSALAGETESGITLVHSGGGGGHWSHGGGGHWNHGGGGHWNHGGGHWGHAGWGRGRGYWRGGRWYGYGGFYGCPWPYYGPYCYPY